MESVSSSISFADSTLIEYVRKGTELVVRVETRDGRIARLAFRDAILVRERCAGGFAYFRVSAAPDDEVLRMAIEVAYDGPPVVHPYSVFALVDPDDLRALEVVAEDCAISIESSKSR